MLVRKSGGIVGQILIAEREIAIGEIGLGEVGFGKVGLGEVGLREGGQETKRRIRIVEGKRRVRKGGDE